MDGYRSQSIRPPARASRPGQTRPEGRRPGFPRRAWLWMLGLLIFGLCLGVPYLGSPPLESHEALVVQRTTSLMNEGGWVVPWTGGRPDVRKPPMPFWIAGGLAVLSGDLNEWTVRIPSVAASLGTMLLLVTLVTRMAGWRTGIVTGFVYLTSAAALTYGRRAEADMQLCFWTTLAVTAFWLGTGEESRRRQVACYVTMWLALALGGLTKGPLPLAIWALAVGGFAVTTRGRHWLSGMLPVLGPLLTLAVAVPWLLVVGIKHPGAFSTWYMESLGRFAGQLGHQKPAYFYVIEAPLLWVPWVLPLAVGLYVAIGRRVLSRQAWAFLLAWGVGGLLLLSLSTGKRLHYALPVTPPFLVFAGLGMNHLLFELPTRLSATARRLLGLHWLLIPLAGVACIVAALRYPDFKLALAVTGGVMTVGLFIVLMLYTRGRRLTSAVTLAVVFLVLQVYGMCHIIVPALNRSNDAAAIGRFLASSVPEGQRCIYPEFDRTVAFYAGGTLPAFSRSEDLAAWRRRHPEGYVVVKGRNARGELRRIGPWEEIDFRLSKHRESRTRYALLRVASSPGGMSHSGSQVETGERHERVASQQSGHSGLWCRRPQPGTALR